MKVQKIISIRIISKINANRKDNGLTIVELHLKYIP